MRLLCSRGRLCLHCRLQWHCLLSPPKSQSVTALTGSHTATSISTGEPTLSFSFVIITTDLFYTTYTKQSTLGPTIKRHTPIDITDLLPSHHHVFQNQ